jgi:5-methylcytosine-specific restriction endonuclease McrA
VTEPTWREIRELTRLRRRQRSVIRYDVDTIVRSRIDAYDDAPITTFYGFIPNQLEQGMWHFQCAKCYICAEGFSRQRLATREHVNPRALGGKNPRNILLACIECNNIKGDRPPTKRELKLLALFLANDRIAFHTVLMTAPPIRAKPPRSSRRRRQYATYAHIPGLTKPDN